METLLLRGGEGDRVEMDETESKEGERRRLGGGESLEGGASRSNSRFLALSVSFLADSSAATSFLRFHVSSCIHKLMNRHLNQDLLSLCQGIIWEDVIGQLWEQLWVLELLGTRRPRDVGPFLGRSLALIRVVAFWGGQRDFENT